MDNAYEMVKKSFEEVLLYWERMQKLQGDEGAEAAEAFERMYYIGVEHLRQWYCQLDKKPESFEAFEQLPEISNLFDLLPDPLQINFLTDIEEIYDGIKPERFD
jgi:hypothetical protein